MMRLFIGIAGMCLLIAAASICVAQVEKTWFDYQNCASCKEWAAQPGLIEHSHDEVHNVSDGLIWVTFIDPEYRDKFRNALAAEDKVSALVQAGKKVPMCRYCSGVDALSRKGVRIEGLYAQGGAEITLYTSTDSTLVKEIQSFGAQAIAELAKANAAFVEGQKSNK